MSNVIVKENETLDRCFTADSKETVQKQEFSRRFAKENITKNQALDVKRNLKLLEKRKYN